MSELARSAEEILSELADLRQVRVAVPRNPKFSRADVVSAFQSAFELIGGTPRLALWANENPTEFYKLFGKLLPSATQVQLTTAPRDPNNLRTFSTEELEELLREELEQKNSCSNVIELADYTEVEGD